MPYLTVFCDESPVSADYHQQYLHKNPDGYCGLGGCGVSFVLEEDQQKTSTYV